MIVNQTVSNIGDAIIFSVQTPLRGLEQITSFTDVEVGVTGTRFFNKEFRFAMQGIRYSEWLPLTLADLQNNIHPSGTIPIKNDLIIEFRYTRAGTDGTGDLTLTSIDLFGPILTSYLQVLDFTNSVFQDIGFTDEYWNKVWVNLLKKLYGKGIVPRYVSRGDDNPLDEDFILIWKCSAYFYALLVALVDNKITKLNQDQYLLAEYIRQRSMNVCGDEDISILQQIAAEIYDQTRRRATLGITYEQGTPQVPVADPLHGELKRLVCYDIQLDEFLFEYVTGGWYTNVNSPTFYGLTNHLQLNKMPENTQNFVDLNKFDVFTGVAIVTDGLKEVAEMTGTSSELKKEFVKVNHGLSYELSFYVRQPILAASLNLEITAEDESGFPVPMLDINTGLASNNILTNVQLLDNTNYWFCSCVIYAYGSPLLSAADSLTSLGMGNNLAFGGNNVKRINVRFLNSGGALDTIRLWDLKMKPRENYTDPVYTNGTDFANIWIKNRNLRFTDTKLENIIREYLIPATSNSIVKHLQ